MKQQKHNLLLISVLAGILIVSCNTIHNYNNENKMLNRTEVTKQVNWVGHWKNEGAREKLVLDIANEYEFNNQNTKVNLTFPEEIYGGVAGDDEVKFVIEQLKKPVADYDIIRLFTNFDQIGRLLNNPQWMETYLVDFGTIPGFRESHLSFLNNKVYVNQYNNRFYGPYNEGQVAALFVNTEVAKKIGINVKQFGMTFDDFLGYITAAVEYNKNHPNIMPIFEYNWVKTDLIFKNLFYSLLGSFDEALDTKLSPEKLAALEKCYEAYDKLAALKPIRKNWRSYDWNNTNQYPLRDSCLFFPNFSFMYNIWKVKDTEGMKKIVPCEFPVFKPSHTYLGGFLSNWIVLKNGPNRDEAVKLMLYWCQPEVAERWVRISKCPSGIKGNLTTSSYGVDDFESYIYTINNKYGANMIFDGEIKYMVGEKNEHLNMNFVEVLEGSLTGKEAFAQLKRRLVY